MLEKIIKKTILLGSLLIGLSGCYQTTNNYYNNVFENSVPETEEQADAVLSDDYKLGEDQKEQEYASQEVGLFDVFENSRNDFQTPEDNISDFQLVELQDNVQSLEVLIDNLVEVLGCTDPKADNYNSLATKDDDSCKYVDICWDKTFGGSNSDVALSIQQTKDLGYIVAGETWSKGAGESDVWVFKLDSNGNLVWDKTFGGNENNRALSIQQTKDLGYIVAGQTTSKGAGGNDAWILKLDSNGNLEWDKTFGGSSLDEVDSIQQTKDLGYIVTGETGSKGAGEEDAWIFKLDENGNLEWDKTFGGSNSDVAYSVQQTNDGGYIVAGDTNSKGAGSYDAWIFKLDSNGNLEWDKTFGGSEQDYAHSIQQTKDLGYIVTGETGSKGAGSYDAWVFKLDSNGNLVWDKTFGGNMDDHAYSIQQTKDLGYIVAGWTIGGAWVFKLDSNGSLEWDKTFGGSNYIGYLQIQQTTDLGYVAASWTYSKGAGSDDAWVFKLDSNGNLECK
ncbi:MAG: hypothetical protein V2A62_05015 [Candidatus Woesearchaeota archaeon]